MDSIGISEVKINNNLDAYSEVKTEETKDILKIAKKLDKKLDFIDLGIKNHNKKYITNSREYDETFGGYWNYYPVQYKQCLTYQDSNSNQFISLINSDINDFTPFITKEKTSNLPSYLKDLKAKNIINNIDFLFVKIPSNQVFLNSLRKISHLDKVIYQDYVINIIKLISFCKPVIMYMEVGVESVDALINILDKNNLVVLDILKFNRTQSILRVTAQYPYLLKEHIAPEFKLTKLNQFSMFDKKTKLYNLESLFIKDLQSFKRKRGFSFLDLTAELGFWAKVSLENNLKYIGIEPNYNKLANLLAYFNYFSIEFSIL